MDHEMGDGYTTTFLLEVFTQNNFVARFIQLKLNFIFISRFLTHPLGDLGVTYALHSSYSSLESPWSTSYSS